MIALLLVLALSLACAPASVLPLTVGRWQVWHPRLALALWLGIGLLGLVLAGLTVLTAGLLVAFSGPAVGIARALVLVSLAWLGLGGIGVLASLALGSGNASHSTARTPAPGASATSSEAGIRAATASRRIRRLPWASPSRPPSTSVAAKPTENSATTSAPVAGARARPDSRAGSASVEAPKTRLPVIPAASSATPPAPSPSAGFVADDAGAAAGEAVEDVM